MSYIYVPSSAGSSFASGLDRLRPAASAGIVGEIYYATDTKKSYQCVSATTWDVVGIGQDRATFGPFTDNAYVNAVGLVGPVFGPNASLAVNFYVNSLPGTGGQNLFSYTNNAAPTIGYNIQSSTSAANTMSMFRPGAAAYTELPGAVLSVGPHTLAVALNAGGTSMAYAWDGVLQTPTAIAGATFTPADVTCTFKIGRWFGAALALTWGAVSWIQGYAPALSNADLVALSASPSVYRPGNITPVPVFDWRAAWQRDGDNVHSPVGSQSQRLGVVGPIDLPLTYR